MTSSLFLPLIGSLLFLDLASAGALLPRLDNGLAITPPMGWNSYNHYNCQPNETIIHSNAQALINLGLIHDGYEFVTVDCGWSLPDRIANGTLTWNPDLFPSGYFSLGSFIHGLGLKFGVYGDAGIKTCMTGTPDQAGSLFHETSDALTFASWGADLLKYDNCYSEVATGYPNTDYAPVVSPYARYKNMTQAVSATGRPMVFQICEWGLDFPSLWAPELGHTWRITNDIIPAWRSIPRILNQAVPQTSFAGPGQWLDLDMLEVGNHVLTTPEEQTHFSLWAIIKSPLVIGTALYDAYTSISASSLAILKNTDVIGYNQDSLGVAATFRRRWTSDYEIWSGPLSGGRTVVAVINLSNETRNLTLALPDVGFQTAESVKDIWNNITAENVVTSYTGAVEAHGTLLLELAGTTTAGQYTITNAQVSGNNATFTQIYGNTASSNYTLVVTFAQAISNSTNVIIDNTIHEVSAGSISLTTTLSLESSNDNTLTIISTPALVSLSISSPPETFYPSTAFSLIGSSTLTTCSPDLCQPVGSKIGYLTPTGSAALTISSLSSVEGAKYVHMYFCNNDIALDTSWGFGTNTRNMTISVNGIVTRIEVPLSGRSSELFSPGLGWQDTGVFGVLIPGWVEDANSVVVSNEGGNEGLVSYGADFVGLGVYW